MRGGFGGWPLQSQPWSGRDGPQDATLDLRHCLTTSPSLHSPSHLQGFSGPRPVSRHQHPGGRTGITDSPSGQCSFQATLCSSGGQIQVFWLQDPGHQSPSVIPVATGLPSGHRPPLGPASSGGSLKPHSCPSLTSHRSGQERFRPQQPGTTAWAH